MAKRKDIFKKHTNLRSLSIVFLSLAVILGVVWYVNSYSERSSAANRKVSRQSNNLGTKVKANEWCQKVIITTWCDQDKSYCEKWTFKNKKDTPSDSTCNYFGDVYWRCWGPKDDRCKFKKPKPDESPPPAAPSSYEPVGRVDGTNHDSCSVWGWACDQDKWSKPLKVRITANGQPVGETTANIQADDVRGVCGGTSNHRFNFSVPADSFVRGAGSVVVDALAVDVNTDGQQTGNTSSILGSKVTYSLRCSK